MEYLERYERRVSGAARDGPVAVTTGAPPPDASSAISHFRILSFSPPAPPATARSSRGVMRPRRARRLRDEGGVARAARRRAGAAGRRVRGRDDQRGRAREPRPRGGARASTCRGWRRTCRDTRKIVNVVGFAVDEYPAVVAGLEEALDGAQAPAVDAFELNVSCPNMKAGGIEFGADPSGAARGRRSVRAARPSGRSS